MESYAADAVYISIMVSADEDPVQLLDVADWASLFSINHPVLADPSKVMDSFVLSGYPVYVVIGKDMKIKVTDLWPFDYSTIESFF